MFGMLVTNREIYSEIYRYLFTLGFVASYICINLDVTNTKSSLPGHLESLSNMAGLERLSITVNTLGVIFCLLSWKIRSGFFRRTISKERSCIHVARTT